MRTVELGEKLLLDQLSMVLPIDLQAITEYLAGKRSLLLSHKFSQKVHAEPVSEEALLLL